MSQMLGETRDAGINPRNYPETDPSATYSIRNTQFGPLPLTVTNEARNAMETMILGQRETILIEGYRFTDTIWELENRKLCVVKKV